MNNLNVNNSSHWCIEYGLKLFAINNSVKQIPVTSTCICECKYIIYMWMPVDIPVIFLMYVHVVSKCTLFFVLRWKVPVGSF